MDYLAQKFIAFANHVRSELRAINERLASLLRLQDQIDSIREQTQADNEAERQPTAVVATLSTPVAISVQAETHQRQSRWDKVFRTLEIAGIAAAIYYASVAFGQWREMIYQTDMMTVNARRSRVEAARQFAITQQSAAVAIKGADTAVKALQSSDESFKKTFRQMKAQTDAQITSANAARVAAEQAKRAADNFRVDQRAWIKVDVEEFNLLGAKDSVGVPVAHFIAKNVGKTAATNIEWRTVLQPVPLGQDPTFEYDIMHYVIRTGIVFPADSHEIRVQMEQPYTHGVFTPRKLTPRELQAFAFQQLWIAAYGRVDYDDIFGEHHETRFCAVFAQGNATDLDASRKCSIEYNAAN